MSYPAKNIFSATLLIMLLAVLFLPLAASAAGPISNGIVPPECQEGPCQLCHLYELANRSINFLLFNLAIPIVVVMLIWGGITLLTAGGSEERQKSGRGIIQNAAIGILIAFFAWAIINSVLLILGFQVSFQKAVSSPGAWYSFPSCAATPAPTPNGGTTSPTQTENDALKSDYAKCDIGSECKSGICLSFTGDVTKGTHCLPSNVPDFADCFNSIQCQNNLCGAEGICEPLDAPDTRLRELGESCEKDRDCKSGKCDNWAGVLPDHTPSYNCWLGP